DEDRIIAARVGVGGARRVDRYRVGQSESVRVGSGDGGGERIVLERLHRAARSGERDEVTADSAAQIGNPPAGRGGGHTAGAAGGHLWAGGLLQAVGGEVHARGVFAELGDRACA